MVVVYRMLFVDCCMSVGELCVVVCCLLFAVVVCCFLFVVCGVWLNAVCCLLFVVRCLLCVVS